MVARDIGTVGTRQKEGPRGRKRHAEEKRSSRGLAAGTGVVVVVFFHVVVVVVVVLLHLLLLLLVVVASLPLAGRLLPFFSPFSNYR